MTLGQQIRKLRDQKGLMQREVGAWINVDGAMISKVEKGDKRINRKHLATLAKKFEVLEDDLQVLWLADRVCSILKNETLTTEVVGEINNRFR